jgi:hypothetical protein
LFRRKRRSKETTEREVPSSGWRKKIKGKNEINQLTIQHVKGQANLVQHFKRKVPRRRGCKEKLGIHFVFDTARFADDYKFTSNRQKGSANF